MKERCKAQWRSKEERKTKDRNISLKMSTRSNDEICKIKNGQIDDRKVQSTGESKCEEWHSGKVRRHTQVKVRDHDESKDNVTERHKEILRGHITVGLLIHEI